MRHDALFTERQNGCFECKRQVLLLLLLLLLLLVVMMMMMMMMVVMIVVVLLQLLRLVVMRRLWNGRELHIPIIATTVWLLLVMRLRLMTTYRSMLGRTM
uniref:Uncharacterized protein n=1 Tax=Anopheles darlingi TaxID=43151 RepID=A0A2M4CXA5_ANODA